MRTFSKDDFEAIVRRLDVELGYVSKHVGTHVRELFVRTIRLHLSSERCCMSVE